jgi:CIC family chloride channel protein
VDGDGRLVGIFTFNDLKRALASDKGHCRLDEVTAGQVVHAHRDHTLDTVLMKLGREGVSQLPVVGRKDTSRLLGIITMHDVAEALSKEEETLSPGRPEIEDEFEDFDETD